MIIGTGIDIVRVKRIKEVVKKWDRAFLEKVFTEKELSYCLSKKDPFQSLAARFACKEAFIKAIKDSRGILFKDIEVRNKNNGEPRIEVSKRLAKILKAKGVKQIHLSLSHEREFAVAQIIMVSDEDS